MTGPVPAQLPEIMTAPEAAEVIGVSDKTLKRWVRNGRVPDGLVFKTPGGHHRFWRDALLQEYADLVRARGAGAPR